MRVTIIGGAELVMYDCLLVHMLAVTTILRCYVYT